MVKCSQIRPINQRSEKHLRNNVFVGPKQMEKQHMHMSAKFKAVHVQTCYGNCYSFGYFSYRARRSRRRSSRQKQTSRCPKKSHSRPSTSKRLTWHYFVCYYFKKKIFHKKTPYCIDIINQHPLASKKK